MKRLWIPLALLAAAIACSNPPAPPAPSPTAAPAPPVATAVPAPQPPAPVCTNGALEGVPVGGHVECHVCVAGQWQAAVCPTPPPAATAKPVATKKPTNVVCKFTGDVGPTGGIYSGKCVLSPTCQPLSGSGMFEGNGCHD